MRGNEGQVQRPEADFTSRRRFRRNGWPDTPGPSILRSVLFGLKKFISFWLMPLPFCLTLIVAGGLLLLLGRRMRLGRRLVAVGITFLLIFSNRTLSLWLIAPLESRYPAIPELQPGAPLPAALAACQYVVVLGGGHADMVGQPATNELSSSALGRLVEGVRLMRALPGARMIVSGPGLPPHPSHAAVLAQAAESLGVAADRIQLIDTAHDTEEEAGAVRAIVGPAPVALVTSAWHMPRAAGLFRHVGVTVVPCPADYIGRPSPTFSWTDLNWDVGSLDRSTMAVREHIGYLWVWLRGKV
jgi:uncharacterized SAM-binding protein YcdF (DUF218 family)